MTDLLLKNYNKYVSLIARRFSKADWHKLPERTRKAFYNSKSIDKWIVNATIAEKMFFLEDLGFTSCMLVFPNDNCKLDDIPELSDFTVDIKKRISAVEKQLELDMFALCVRELAPVVYNLSQNSNNKIYAIKSDFKALNEANDNYIKENFKSATDYAKSEETRENILKFVLNVLMDFNLQTKKELSLQAITILFHLRECNDVGIKFKTVVSLFNGSLGERQVQNYLAYLSKTGYIQSTGKKLNTVYMLSSKGMLFVNDYTNRILSL